MEIRIKIQKVHGDVLIHVRYISREILEFRGEIFFFFFCILLVETTIVVSLKKVS